jgi:hypothetical protein
MLPLYVSPFFHLLPSHPPEVPFYKFTNQSLLHSH